MLRIGIVGLAGVGKTTLYRILTRAHGGGLGSGKASPHVGVVRVPDARLDKLAELVRPEKTTYAAIEYVDTAGSFIDIARSGVQAATLREMDALAHVVRAFENEAVPAPSGSVNPRRDAETVELEIALSDLGVVEKRLERVERDVKKQKSPALDKELAVLEKCRAALEKQTPLREVAFPPEEERTVRGFTFLTSKPEIVVLNLGEADALRAEAAQDFAASIGLTRREKTAVAAICGKVEAELAELDESDAGDFLASYGLKESAVTRLVRSCYQLLGLISFFTAGEKECRAWTIPQGANAAEAAGAIHSDFQKNFIRAEVVSFEDFASAGDFAEAKNRGQMRLEGKEYIVRDGDVMLIRHSAKRGSES